MSGTITLAETAAVDTQQGAIENLQANDEFIAAFRVEDVAGSSTAIDTVVSMPADASVDVAVAATIATGGLAHLDFSEDITIDTAGTELDVMPKDIQSGSTPAATVEQGGTYTTNGATIETIIPGSDRAGGATTQGVNSVASSGVVLGAGDSIRYTVTNQSGAAADYSIHLSLVEVEN